MWDTKHRKDFMELLKHLKVFICRLRFHLKYEVCHRVPGDVVTYSAAAAAAEASSSKKNVFPRYKYPHEMKKANKRGGTDDESVNTKET